MASSVITAGSRDVLIIVDVQRDFLPGGALAVPRGDEVAPVINRLAVKFEHYLLTQDWHPAGHSSFASSHKGAKPFDVTQAFYGKQVLWPDHCVAGTAGALFAENLDTPRAELVIRKGYNPELDSYSAFFENDRKTPTGLGGYLKERGFRRIFLAGLATDFCVFYSAIDGRRLGFEVLLVEDGCRGIDAGGSLAASMAEMNSAGVVKIDSARVEME